MGTLRSKYDWSGREINGVVLGTGTFLEESEDYIWDGDVPTGTIDSVGVIALDSDDTLGDSEKTKVESIVAPEIAPDDPPITQEEKNLGVKKITIVDGEVVALDSKNKEIALTEKV